MRMQWFPSSLSPPPREPGYEAIVRSEHAAEMRAARARMNDERRAVERNEDTDRRRTARARINDERRAAEHRENTDIGEEQLVLG